MKKLILLFIFGIFLVGTVSASWDWDNVKDYNETSKTLTITNRLGFGEKIAEVQLNTQLIHYVLPGKNRLVAEFEIRNEDDYSDVFKKMELFNRNAGMRKFERDFTYKYRTQVGVTERPMMKQECREEFNSKNQTTINICTDVLDYIRETPIYEWTELNTNEVLPKGDITIGIFTDVYEGDDVEWIPTIFGERINFWAVWKASDSIKLMTYWRLEESTGTNSLEAVNGTYNFTKQAVGDIESAIGIINLGWNGTADDYSNTTNFITNEVGSEPNFTISVWIRPDQVEGTHFVFLSSVSSDIFENEFYLDLIEGGTIGFFMTESDGSANGVILESTSSVSVGEWMHVAVTYTGTVIKLYINSVLEDETKSVTAAPVVDINQGLMLGAYMTGASIANNFFNGTIDEPLIANRTWNQTEINDLYNSGAGISFNNFVDPVPTITHPQAIGYIIDISNLNYTISGANLDSCLNSIDSGLTNLSVVTAGTNFTGMTSVEGSNTWTVYCNNTNDDWGEDSVTFTIDTTAPVITTTSPPAIVNFSTVGTNLTLSWTIVDANIDTIQYDYNGTNITLSGLINSTGFIVESFENNNLILFANDTEGNENTTIVQWEYKLFEHAQAFQNTTLEGNTENFEINFTVPTLTPATINLVHNGTFYDAIFENPVGNNYTATRNITIPDISSADNLTFLWNIVFTDGSEVNTTLRNQSVSILSIDACTTNTVLLLNLSLVDEEAQTNATIINSSIEVAINIFSSERTLNILNFSDNFSKINPVEICLNINLTEQSSYLMDAIIKYEARDHATEYYNLVDFTTNNITTPELIILYDLLTADSTEFKITFTDENFVRVEGALVFIERQYVAEDLFKTVELPKTDSNGETVGHFVRNDVIYNIRVVKDGEVIGLFQNIKTFCDDFSIGDCQIVLEATSASSFGFEYDDAVGLTYSSAPTYNETTRTMRFDFSTSSGNVQTVFMNVTRQDVFGNQTLCSNSLTSSSGTLTCTIPHKLDDTLLVTSVTVDAVTSIITNTPINSSGLGSIGYLMWFILSFLIILMVGEHKTGIFIGMLISYVGALSLGLVKMSLFGLGSAGIWMITITIIGIYKLNKERVE